jgi:D-beta-D-heptose 7-phosphate kinase/D-beta-D-heptose 1-phosphate adenosyltransferase
MTLRDASSKILDPETLIDRYGRPREATVVFTNGVFDVMHRGHTAYLAAARARGDVLVVGLNTDASVKRLGKGPGRPINREDDRAAVVAALECVDAVCLFGEDTPRALVEALLPDVLVKGGDYARSQVVGREAVEAAGGRVELIPFLGGYSTSGLVARIKGVEHE